jgi:hypothetical protein
MNKLLLLALLFTIFGCAEEKKEEKAHTIEQKDRPTLYAEYGNSVGKLEFIPKLDRLRKNSIIVKSGIRVFQTIKLRSPLAEEFELIDWNFDGYKDVSIRFLSGSAGVSYEIYNYDKVKNRFILNRELLDNYLQIDSIHQRVVFTFSSGCDIKNWDTMKYVNNKLVFEKGLNLTRLPDNLVRVKSSKMIEGKIIEKIDTIQDIMGLWDKY